jgi:hypothetical protein
LEQMFRLVRDQRLDMLEGKRLVGAVGIEFTVRSTSPVDSGPSPTRLLKNGQGYPCFVAKLWPNPAARFHLQTRGFYL